MPVNSITAKHGSEAGDDSDLGSPAVKPFKHVRYDVVHSADATDDEILSDPRVPQPRSILSAEQFFVVTRRSLKRVNTLLSELSVDYESPALGPSQNPLDVPVKIKYYTIKNEEEIDVDIHGKAIKTVNGEKFDPAPREVQPFPIMWIQKPVNFDPSFLIDRAPAGYTWSTNSDTFRGRPAGSLLMYDMEAESVAEDAFDYWVLTLQIARKDPAPGSTAAKTWWKRLIAQGYWARYDLPDPGGPPERLIIPAERHGLTVQRPVFHDIGTGRMLDDDEDAQWYEFETKYSKPWAPLSLILGL